MPKLKKATRADISAATSNNVVVQKFRNKTVLSNFIAPKNSKSVKKKKTNDQFAKANAWAKGILKFDGMKELYSKGINNKLSNAHTVAVRDFMRAPEVPATVGEKSFFHFYQRAGIIGGLCRVFYSLAVFAG